MSLNLQQGNLCRPELSDGSNVNFKQHSKMFQRIDLRRYIRGSPSGILCGLLKRNLNICMSRKKEKELFMNLIGLKPFSPVLYFICYVKKLRIFKLKLLSFNF